MTVSRPGPDNFSGLFHHSLHFQSWPSMLHMYAIDPNGVWPCKFTCWKRTLRGLNTMLVTISLLLLVCTLRLTKHVADRWESGHVTRVFWKQVADLLPRTCTHLRRAYRVIALILFLPKNHITNAEKWRSGKGRLKEWHFWGETRFCRVQWGAVTSIFRIWILGKWEAGNSLHTVFRASIWAAILT